MTVATELRMRTVGRKPKDYETKQIRADKETAEILHKLAGLAGQDLPDFLREWLRPLAVEEFKRRVEQLHSEVMGKPKGKK